MTDLSCLPPLREVIAEHKLSARKTFGQNFLLDENLTDRIARLAGPLKGHDILEIGPGPGGLTRSLVRAGARKVLCVEIDKRFVPALQPLTSIAPVEIVHADALKWNPLGQLNPPIKVVSNLPFNSATPLFARWLESVDWPPFWTSLTLMFQQETAERILADIGSKSYGRLSVLAQWRTQSRLALRVPAAAFVPKPKVNACVIQVRWQQESSDWTNPYILRQITKAAFGQRRKMMRTSLKSLGPDIDSSLRAAGIPPDSRPETITVAQFCQLARQLQREREGS